MARDMHCYFILCNVSHYGDSCVTKPDSHVTMNMLKVKGGNTIDNKAVVLSSTLDVEGLRGFQKKDMGEQEKSKKFKKTPPDYIASNVDKRKDQFMFEYKDKTDGFLADLAKNIMEY